MMGREGRGERFREVVLFSFRFWIETCSSFSLDVDLEFRVRVSHVQGWMEYLGRTLCYNRQHGRQERDVDFAILVWE